MFFESYHDEETQFQAGIQPPVLGQSFQTDHSPESFEYAELSSPNSDNLISSPISISVNFKDLGSFDADDEAKNAEANIMNRLNQMSGSDCLVPTSFFTDKQCLLAILNETEWVIGWSLDYIANMLISQKTNDYDCAILKTEVASWLTTASFMANFLIHKKHQNLIFKTTYAFF